MSDPAPAVARASFDGLLFDMDGTIIDSTEAVVQHWHTYVLLHTRGGTDYLVPPPNAATEGSAQTT